MIFKFNKKIFQNIGKRCCQGIDMKIMLIRSRNKTWKDSSNAELH